MIPRTRGAALLLALLLAATPAGAKSHKVRSGETFASIAEKEFGDAALGRLLALHNGGDERARPQPGTRVLLPQARVLRLMLPQRFSDLAERVLDDPSLEELLARVNGRPTPELLPFLEVVVIPAFLELPRVPGESHADVARRVYGPGGPVWPVELANREPRDRVRVPVVEFFDEDLADEKAEAVEKARAQLKPRPPRPEPAEQTVARANPATPRAEPPAGSGPATGDRASPGPAAPARKLPETAPERAQPTPVNSDPRATTAGDRVAAGNPEPGRRATPADGSDARGQETEGNPLPGTRVARAGPGATPGPGAGEPAAGDTLVAAAPSQDPSAPASPAVEPASAEPPGSAPASAANASLSAPRSAIPEPIPWPPLERVRRAYERGEYHRSEVDGHALFAAGKVPPELRPTGWLLVGLSELARGREAQALASFGRARAADPALDLDPFYYPPKVREAFLRAEPGRGGDPGS